MPHFLTVQVLTDGSFSTVTKSPISKGTKFGPFQAEKTKTLEPVVEFPLKLFEDKENTYFLNASDEEKCSWLMYVGHADCLEEQNLICYQVG